MYIQSVMSLASNLRCGKRGLPFCLSALLLLAVVVPSSARAQQVVQRGALGTPSEVLDETQQWTTPLLVASDKDVEIYIPDISSPDWLRLNYPEFQDKRQYTITLFTFYKTMRACRANQIGWGLGDAEHVNACADISYRVREGSVDAHMKTVTLIMAGMVGQDGQLDPTSIQRQAITKTWADLDTNTRTALEKTTGIVTEQMARYDHRLQNSQ